jgi:hypothetical protein
VTLQASGAISLAQIAAEFGLASNSTFPSAFYGKGGAPNSGALSFADFYGRSNGTPPPSFSASADNTAPSAVASTSSVTTGTVNVSTSGGTSPFTYAWTKLDGDAVTALSPTSASTQFRGTGMVSGESRTADFRCTVTATGGATAQTQIVTATVTHT